MVKVLIVGELGTISKELITVFLSGCEDVVVVCDDNNMPLCEAHEVQLLSKSLFHDKYDFDYELDEDDVYEIWSNTLLVIKFILIGFKTPYKNKDAPCRAQPELRPNIV